MPTESIIVVSAILAVFTTFAVMLAWVDHYARGYRSGPHPDLAVDKANCVKEGGTGCGSPACQVKHAGKTPYIVDAANLSVAPANDANAEPRVAQA